MKTPREYLFDRHRAAETKLDALRENVVATQLSSPASQSPSTPSGERVGVRGLLLNIWYELIFPCRRVWIGLAATWMLVLIFNLSNDAGSPTIASKGSASSSAPNISAALQEQRRLLAQLLGNVPSSPTVLRRTPGPRGELREVIRFA